MSQVLLAIDAEIARLQQVRELLTGAAAAPSPKPALKHSPRRRALSDEARKKIGDAVRRRWARQKAAQRAAKRAAA
jgi:hypothetical protein